MKIFGWQHFVYLAVFFTLATVGIICAKKFAKTEKSQNIIIKVTGVILFLSIFASRLSITLCGSNPQWHHMLPNQFCGMSSLVLSLAVIFGKKNNNVYHFVWFIALLGGVITMIYPDFLPQDPSFFYPPTITGMLHHSLSIVMVVILLVFNQIEITYKKWYCTVFGFACYFAFGAFLIGALGYGDAFHIRTPILSGTPLTAWIMAPLYVVIYGVIVLIVEIIRKKKSTTKEKKEENL
ncbi:MAG: YwaF family protein [Clostridia bacterium]|nr:YwaF family protein [Clostridia bacterium]